METTDVPFSSCSILSYVLFGCFYALKSRLGSSILTGCLNKLTLPFNASSGHVIKYSVDIGPHQHTNYPAFIHFRPFWSARSTILFYNTLFPISTTSDATFPPSDYGWTNCIYAIFSVLSSNWRCFIQSTSQLADLLLEYLQLCSKVFLAMIHFWCHPWQANTKRV